MFNPKLPRLDFCSSEFLMPLYLFQNQPDLVFTKIELSA
ncbi:hypothetical protein OVS_02095 [Mycoplasma ovis str. Michigan]|uniref:Uncharacterized protein n=1 Tax=Mycoplasma ovis str. Michigan TaxID=1415773 RepID=A0ABN4BLZ9_9MOLU|nr:hypothetical protein OVS_02095 [Mycoplasma ovis str. Michigan]